MAVRKKQFARPLVAAVLGASCGSCLPLYRVLHKPPSPPVIAFIPRTSGTTFTEDMHRGAVDAAKRAGYQIYWNAPTRDDDLDRQIRIAEGAVRDGARALILGPTNIWGLNTMVNHLTSTGFPVVFVQTGPAEPPGPHLTSITPDQEKFGELAAARVALVTGGSGEVAIVGIDRGTPETLARAVSFLRSIAAYPGIRVVAESPGAVQTMEAEQSTREVVSAYPRLKAIFAVSADATQGAMLALEDVDPHPAVSLIGSDRDLFLIDGLDSNEIDSLVTSDGYQIGYRAVQVALVGIAGRPMPPPQQVEVELLTRGNIVPDRR